jgi:exonuclease VII large subunit
MFSRIAARLSPQTLRTHIARERERVTATARRSGQCLRVHVERRRERYDAMALRLNAGRMAYVNVRRTQIARARERILALQERARLAFRSISLSLLVKAIAGRAWKDGGQPDAGLFRC